MGVHITAKGAQPSPTKLDAIDQYELPTTVRDLKRFLGICGFYHRFVPNFSCTAAPLTDLTRNVNTKSNTPIVWTETAKSAFSSLKRALKNSITLAFPSPRAQLELATDASNRAAGASPQSGC